MGERKFDQEFFLKYIFAQVRKVRKVKKECRTDMHIIPPDGQMWKAEAFKLACYDQNFVLLCVFLDKCTL